MSFIQELFSSRNNKADGQTFVGQQDRLWWDPVTNRFYYSDGVTPGGIPVGGGGNGTPGGANTTVQFNNSGSFGGSPNFTYDVANSVLSVTGNISSNYFIGNGSQLTGITALPPQAGNANTWLTTDGNTASWSPLPTYLPVLTFSGNIIQISTAFGVLPVLTFNGSTANIPIY